MKRIIILLLFMSVLITPVSATDFTAPMVPAAAEEYMPPDHDSFASDLWYIIRQALSELRPDISDALKVCLSILSVCMLLSFLACMPGRVKQSVGLAAAVVIGLLLLNTTRSMIKLGTETIQSLSDYEKLLLPVMTSSLAAQGGTTTATALHVGTAVFNTVLTEAVANLLVPLVYIYIFVCLAKSAINEPLLGDLRNLCKWSITWILKIILYIFTGYMAITNVISGSVDATALKATKLAISGAVPVVGGILSDASETLLVSVGIMKSSAGVYGLLAAVSIVIGPFLKIAVQYLILKATTAICSVFSAKEAQELVKDFSGAMGFLLAMTGTACMMVFVSTVCFMKGIT